jgi:hypothetical protein
VATITVTVNDGAASNNTVVRSFTVTVIRPLVISNLHEVSNDARSITLAWNTDRPATSVLSYWTAVSSNSISAQSSGTNYSATLTNLTPNMTYNIRAQAATSNAVAAVDGTSATEPSNLLAWHAEDGVLGPPMRQLTSPQTENGKYVESGIGGTVTYTINTKRGLNYRVWARVRVPAGGASFSASIDGGAQKMVFAGDYRATNAWHWVLLTDPAQNFNPMVFPLETGTHQILFGSSAKNISLDEFTISNDPLWQPILPTTVPLLSVVRTGDMTADLQWFDPSRNAVSVSIESSVDGRLFTPNQTVAANTSSMRVSNLLPGVTYYFRVYSYNSLDRTDYSNTAAAR